MMGQGANKLHAMLQALRQAVALAVGAVALLGAGAGADTALAADTKCDPTMSCCASGEVGGEPGCAGGGNPINVITGNKYQREEDLRALPGVLGLEIVRHYNSVSSREGDVSGVLGKGWRLSYEVELSVKGSGLTITQADGTPLHFAKGMLAPHRFMAADPANGRVSVKTGARGAEYQWSRLDGRQFMFDANGRLTQIKVPSGEFVSLAHDPRGLLLKVTDPQGRSLVLNYLDAKSARATDRFRGVQSIDTPVGRFEYEYGSGPASAAASSLAVVANLVKVTAPAPDAARRSSRVYHYEDRRFPTLLTGISIAGAGSDGKLMNTRLSTYAYDEFGRGNLSVKGEPARLQLGADGRPVEPKRLADGTGVEQVVFVRGKRDQVVVYNSLAQPTVFTHAVIAGQARLLEVRGAGCAHCAGPNVRFGYDKLGRLNETTQITPGGQPLQTVRSVLDTYGRTRSVVRIDYRGGKALPPQMMVRYEYPEPLVNEASATEPTLIATPSVVHGREHLIRIAYNDAGQPIRMTEEGFGPQDGEGPSAVAALSRTVNYSYARVNGRSLLMQIDGPVPNGPKGDPSDSDITRYQWDTNGRFVTAVTLPMNLVEKYQRDGATGHLVERIGTDGVSSHYLYTASGQVARTERLGAVTVQQYDALGQLSAVSDTAGRAIAMEHDLAGHPVRVSDAQGYFSQLTLDTEGLVKVAGLYEPGRTLPLRASYRTYDDQRRLKSLLRPDGRLETVEYNRQGGVASRIDGEGVLHLSGPGTRGNLRADVALARDGEARVSLRGEGALLAQDKPHAGARKSEQATLENDFGGVVLVRTSDHGTRSSRFDAAGRMIEVVQRGRDQKVVSVQRHEHDAASRLVRKVTLDAEGHVLSTLKITYDGPRVTSREDDVQVVRYRWDEAGKLSANEVSFKDEAGRVVFTTTLKTAYDPATGEASSFVLADASVMRLQRDPKTQLPRAIMLQSKRWAGVHDWMGRSLPASLANTLQGWLPEQTVVRDLAFHPYDGITAYVHGNGLRTGKQFDSAGRLTAMSVRGAVEQSLRYAVGPRVRSIEDNAAGKIIEASFEYGSFGGLKTLAANRSATSGGTAWDAKALTHVVRDAMGRTIDDGRWRYTYTANGQIRTVADGTGRLVARYRYNASGERVSKTLFEPAEHSTYYLWQSGRVVAEIEVDAQHPAGVTAQYLYLTQGELATPIAKLEGERAQGNATGSARVLFVHASHRGEPLAMTDADQRIVWRARPDAWGYVSTQELESNQATLNLRLPGQYFDAETGLHDNWHRSYDARPGSPLRGSYMSADPLGYPDGPNAYLYAGGDPINAVDPKGLYQIDMHYYMTFFLGIAAGLSPTDARDIALAAQYVDDNPVTKPLDEPDGKVDIIKSLTTNQDRLRHYHFMADTLKLPVSQIHDITEGNQLYNLYQASQHEGTNCGQKVFFGEMLHALGDTYAHARPDNTPYKGVDLLGLGEGHGLNDSDPDYTFDHYGFPAVIDKIFPSMQPDKGVPWAVSWGTNAGRTLDAEAKLFAELGKSKWATGPAVSFDSIRIALIAFNSTGESEDYSFTWDPATGTQTRTKNSHVDHSDIGTINKAFDKKLTVLNKTLHDMGLTELDLFKDEWGYDLKQAAKNRAMELGKLHCADYPGVILPEGVCPFLK